MSTLLAHAVPKLPFTKDIEQSPDHNFVAEHADRKVRIEGVNIKQATDRKEARQRLKRHSTYKCLKIDFVTRCI